MRETINITRGTDVVLNDRLIFRGKTFDPSLAVNLDAHLVSRAGVRTALGVEVVDDYLVISIPWVTGRMAGLYGLEVRGMTNGLRWATYADSLIRYTTQTAQGDSEEVTVSGDAYDITQQVSYRFGESPISEALVTVDNNVGEPSVAVSYASRVLQLAFSCLKGNGIRNLVQTSASAADNGENIWTVTFDDGSTATMTIRNGSRGNGIANVVRMAESADYDGVNIWRVVTTDGVYFDITVKNGSRGNGIESVVKTESSDEDGGVNTWRQTLTDGTVVDISVRNGRRGAQGPQGDSAVYNPDDPDVPDFVMANTTGQSTTKAMTQKAVTDELEASKSYILEEIDISQYGWTAYRINHSTQKWQNNGAYTCSVIPVVQGDTYILSGSSSNGNPLYAAYLGSSSRPNNTVIFAEGSTSEFTWPSGEEHVIPNGVNYLYILTKDNTVSYTLALQHIAYMRDKVSKEAARIDKIEDKIDELHLFDKTGTLMTLSRTNSAYIGGNIWYEGTPATNSCYIGAVSPGDAFRVIPQEGQITQVIFLTSNDTTVNTRPSYAGGLTMQPANISSETIVIAPEDAAYMYVRIYISSVDRTPSIYRLVNKQQELEKLAADAASAVTKMNDNGEKHINDHATLVKNLMDGVAVPYTTYIAYAHISTNTGEVYNNTSSTNRHVYYNNHLYKKGDVINIDIYETHSGGGALILGFTPDDPTEIMEQSETLFGLQLTDIKSVSTTVPYSYDVIVPYDGYMLYYRYSSDVVPRFTKYSISGSLAKVLDEKFKTVVLGNASEDDSSPAQFMGGYSEIQEVVSNLKHHGSTLVLLYFSDPHASLKGIKGAADIKSNVSGIDDVLSGGDNVSDQPTDPYTFFDDSLEGRGRTMLTVVGNHDVYQAGTKLPQKDVYDIYFGEHTESWSGVTFPENVDTDGKCYWYKDYASVKVRLVGLDCINWSSAQGTWLQGVLADAITNTYHVVICMHYRPYNFQSMRNCNFCTLRGLASADAPNNSAASDSINSIVQNAVDNGLKFVCYLAGHHHKDYFGNVSDHPSLYALGIEKPVAPGSEGDAQRWNQGGGSLKKEWWAYEIIGVNTTYGIMSVAKIGNNRDMFGRPMNHMTFDYINGEILEQS